MRLEQIRFLASLSMAVGSVKRSAFCLHRDVFYAWKYSSEFFEVWLVGLSPPELC